MTRPKVPAKITLEKPFQLDDVRQEIMDYCARLRDKEGPYGCYRMAVRQRPDLYASVDIALMRVIMGENFQTSLTETQRREWVDHINSYIEGAWGKSKTGTYGDTHGHSKFHANGMVIGALGPLGGKQFAPCRLYDDLNTIEKIEPWLENIDWSIIWGTSHWFWGGMHCYSMSKACSPDWRAAVFAWLDKNLDEKTGWWRKGVPHRDRHTALGGSAHIVPIYEHHGHPCPYPERVIDSILAMQLPSGRWNANTHDPDWISYLELDALYVLNYARKLVTNYREEDILDAVRRSGRNVLEFWQQERERLFQEHPHIVLATVSTFGLLQQFLPDVFRDDVQWTDIFSDIRLYRTDLVEILDD